ncbi:MAG: S9 family peptidase [Woeseiaceae bacterium]|nr:S9 family peptidase [Woeseiaceae bacterium]
MKFERNVLMLLVAVGLAGCGQSEEPAVEAVSKASLDDFELVDRSVYFGNPERTQGRISSDGKMMSFIAPLDGVLNLWVAPLGDFDAAKPLTNDKLRGIGGHQWALNGKNVLYVRDTGGNEDFHIYSVDLDGGEAIDLTPYENIRGTFVGSSHRHPDEYLIGINNRDPQWHDVWRVNVTTGEKTLVEEHNRFGQLVADLDLNIRLATAPTPDGGTQVFKKTDEGDWQEIFKIEPEDALTSGPLGFTEDNEHFLMLDSSGRDKTALLRVNINTDEREILAEGDVADISQILADPVTNEPLAYSVEHKKREWTAMADSVAGDLDRLRALNGSVSVLSQTRDNSLWMVASDGSTEPLTYYSYDRAAGELTKLFAARPEVNALPLNVMHPLSIQSRDGLELVSYLTLPPHVDPDGDGRPDEAVPMVLVVHGGPWARDSYGYSSWSQWLSNRGFAVMNVNYRGSTGFGKGFLNAGNREWAAAMHDDLIDAVDWAVEEGIAQRDKVAIAGGSYGGYATLVGLTFTPDTFACGVDIVGPSNLVTLIQSIPPYWKPFLDTFTLRVGDISTEEGQKFLRSRSPLYKADQISKPLLIGQGANDPRVKQPEADQIVAAMEENQLPVTYVLYPDEGHGFARPENRESFYAIMETFLADCLDGRSQPMEGAFEGSSTMVPSGAEFVTGLVEAMEGFEPVIKK